MVNCNRISTIIHQSCKQLHTLADSFVGDSWTISRTVESIDSLRRSMAEAQHHGIITLYTAAVATQQQQQQ